MYNNSNKLLLHVVKLVSGDEFLTGIYANEEENNEKYVRLYYPLRIRNIFLTTEDNEVIERPFYSPAFNINEAILTVSTDSIVYRAGVKEEAFVEEYLNIVRTLPKPSSIHDPYKFVEKDSVESNDIFGDIPTPQSPPGSSSYH